METLYKNKSAEGVDQVTCEIFHTNKTEDMKQLQIELREHLYESLPVKNVILYKGEKVRTIALYAMCDKVVIPTIW